MFVKGYCHEEDPIHHRDIPLRGLLHLAILSIIKETPTYGSDICQKLKEKFGIDAPRPLVYTLLRRMERDGLVVSKWSIPGRGPARRVYYITDQGLDYVVSVAKKLRKVLPIIESILRELSE